MEGKEPAVPPDASWALGMQQFNDFDYSGLKVVHSGKNSLVWSAVYCGSHAGPLVGSHPGSRVCIKGYLLARMTPSEAIRVRRELALLKELEHPNIVRGLGAFRGNLEPAVCLVTSYCENGDLCDAQRLFNHNCIPDEDVRTKIARPLLHALTYLHGKGIMHRDLKPENVVVSCDGTSMLCDFGLAINFVQDTPVSRVGTFSFMAPEVIALAPTTAKTKASLRAARISQYTESVDVWGLGCLIFEVLHGRPLFCGKDDAEIERSILMDKLVFPRRTVALTPVSEAAVDFMAACLMRNPLKRPSATELLCLPCVAQPQSIGPGRSCSSVMLGHQPSLRPARRITSLPAETPPTTTKGVWRRFTFCRTEADVVEPPPTAACRAP